ncbi:sigma-70 family RNA polymerase sigma factor [Amycolatopsis sp. NPDC058986]|uniref:sigma-70 family RNA polymerase sigma factor n=1 Tax=unclassified Amycolatopsis TaxID=2618356 RepID=UPI003672DCE4
MTELGTVPPQAASESDEQALLQRLRDGEDAAFGELFELHAAAVRRLAQSLASDRSEAEDITAETFFRVLQALRRGAGPRDYVRAYLLTVARRVSWEWHGARRDVPVSDDELNFHAGPGADTHSRAAEHTLITTAFTSLPERWRTVLWQTEVEGEQPAMVATQFGLSANATAALARRARQGLRAAYLQAHLSVNRGPDSCRAVVEKLGGFTAGSVTGAEAERIKAHLLGCSSCRATQDELLDVCSSLRAHAGVLVLLVPAAGSLGGAASSVLATVKSVVLGSKVKVGLALASTAAAGAVGFAAGPVVFGPQPSQDIGLPGGGAPELAVLPPGPSPLQPPPQPPRVGVGWLNGRGVVPAVHPHVPAGQPAGQEGQQGPLGAAEVPRLPVVNVPSGRGGEAGRPDTGTTASRGDLPSPQPSMTSTSSSTTPRMDPSATESPRPSLTSEPTDSGKPVCTKTPTSSSRPTRTSTPTGSRTSTTTTTETTSRSETASRSSSKTTKTTTTRRVHRTTQSTSSTSRSTQETVTESAYSSSTSGS